MEAYETTYYFTMASSYKTQSIRSADDEKKCSYFISLVYIHMRGKASKRRLNCIAGLTLGCRSEL